MSDHDNHGLTPTRPRVSVLEAELLEQLRDLRERVAALEAETRPRSVLKPEGCCEPDCSAKVERRDAGRCGGILFGTLDDSGYGCGRFFCDRHLTGKLGPFYCRVCRAEAVS